MSLEIKVMSEVKSRPISEKDGALGSIDAL